MRVRTKNEMNMVFMDDGSILYIEEEQNSVRSNIIDQYVKRRKELELTQSELAQRTGMARENITRFESGRYNPSLEIMVKIAAALEMELKIDLVERG
ncbi:MAG: helix-turn-helix transcriptional regulator [Agathobacter sp.]|nr:helix-turn-helix transcriptional regulator [Agathobacter sp.]